jgi:integrase
LKEIYLKNSGPWLFPGAKKDKPIYPSSWVSFSFCSILRELGLPLVEFYSLRHSFNKLLLDMGTPTLEVMQIMVDK